MIYTRQQQKHDIEANWIKAVNFTPLQGEIIIYDSEIDADGNTLALPEGRTKPYIYERIKIGDGITNVNLLPFIANDKVDKEEGKGLSTNDFTNEHKTKLDNTPNFYIQPNEPVNAPIGSIWIDTDTTGDVYYIEEVEF